MFFHDVGDDVFVAVIAEFAVFDGEREPPELDFNSLLVKVLNHFLDANLRERCLCAAASRRNC